jgi:hypothetical protein
MVFAIVVSQPQVSVAKAFIGKWFLKNKTKTKRLPVSFQMAGFADNKKGHNPFNYRMMEDYPGQVKRRENKKKAVIWRP